MVRCGHTEPELALKGHDLEATRPPRQAQKAQAGTPHPRWSRGGRRQTRFLLQRRPQFLCVLERECRYESIAPLRCITSPHPPCTNPVLPCPWGCANLRHPPSILTGQGPDGAQFLPSGALRCWYGRWLW